MWNCNLWTRCQGGWGGTRSQFISFVFQMRTLMSKLHVARIGLRTQLSIPVTGCAPTAHGTQLLLSSRGRERRTADERPQ